jgi:tRNA (guanine-N7-)-methyltransferase
MLIVYNFFYILLLPILIFRDLVIIKKNKLKIISKKFGLNITGSKSPTIWLHGVSLGEIKILSPLAKRLINQGESILISTTTNTGREEVYKVFRKKEVTVLTFPYDLGFIYKKIIKKFNVKKLVLFESEFWPNLLNSSPKNLKIMSLNTSISDSTFSRFNFIKGLAKKMIRRIDLYLAQSQLTVDRLKLFDAKKIKLLGNIKINPENYEINKNLDTGFNEIFDDDSLFKVVLGSSHKGEEEFVFNAWKNIENSVLILAPRHPERIPVVKQMFKNQKNVYVFEEVGSLFDLYSQADVAIVGGSITFKKGHNFMEPVYANIPSITGDYLENYQDLKAKLCDTGIFETFKTESELSVLLNKYTNSELRQKKLNEQQIALEKISGSYESVLVALDEL